MRPLKTTLFIPFVLGLSAMRAHALTINPTYDSSITGDPSGTVIISSIQSAINVYQTTFTNPIIVNITFAEMSSGPGRSSTFYSTIDYSQYRAALQADKQAANDASFLAYVPNGPNNPVNGNSQIGVTTANLRALGIYINVASDSTVSLNTSLMNLSRSGPRTPTNTTSCPSSRMRSMRPWDSGPT